MSNFWDDQNVKRNHHRCFSPETKLAGWGINFLEKKKEIVPYVEALKPPGIHFLLMIFSKSIHLHFQTQANKLIKLPA